MKSLYKVFDLTSLVDTVHNGQQNFPTTVTFRFMSLSHYE